MSLIDWNVFDTHVREGSLRKVNEIIELWNANSGNALRLSTFSYAGGIFEQVKWDIDDFVEVTDIYGANTDVTPNTLGTVKQNTVKFFFETGTYQIEGSNISWIESNMAQAIAELSNKIAEFVFRKYLFQLIAVMVNTYENNTDVVNDESSTAGLSQAGLNRSHAIFGDRSEELVVQVMHGKAKHKLIGDAIDNGAQLFTAGGVTVIDILGKRTIVTDCPSLIDDVAVPAEYKVLVLKQMAGEVFETGDFKVVVEGDKTGKKRLYTNVQGEGTASLRLMGYSYDAGNGTSSPTSTELETGASWPQYVDHIKETGGVLYIGAQVNP